MLSQAENLLNPLRYHLSETAQQRLRWMDLLDYECAGKGKKAAGKIGISREWLSKLKNIFERHGRHPRSLEPPSRAPHRTERRHRIHHATEEKILAIRDAYGWGKDNMAVVLKRDHHRIASPSTVNRRLHRHQRIDHKISARNQKAWAEKKLRESGSVPLIIKYRPP